MLNGNPHNRHSINVIKCLLMPSALLGTSEITEKHCVSSSSKGTQAGKERRGIMKKPLATPGSKCKVLSDWQASQLQEVIGPGNKLVGNLFSPVGFVPSILVREIPVG